MGIKNGGATCYMNSLFQQLFMQPSIREFVLAGAECRPPAATAGTASSTSSRWDESQFWNCKPGAASR